MPKKLTTKQLHQMHAHPEKYGRVPWFAYLLDNFCKPEYRSIEGSEHIAKYLSANYDTWYKPMDTIAQACYKLIRKSKFYYPQTIHTSLKGYTCLK